MIAYASHTGNKRNLAFLKEAGWRLMVSPQDIRPTNGTPYALDNGAWTAYARQELFDSDAFKRALDLVGEFADFIVLPDIVEGGLRSLDFSMCWLDYVRAFGRPIMLPVQNAKWGERDMQIQDVDPVLDDDMGIFIGGSTEFKERTLGDWGDFGSLYDIHVHCGRVNSQRRLRMCKQAYVDSFDGSGPSRYLQHAMRMDRELKRSEVVQ